MLNWNNINTVLLDMDGTLLDLAFDNYFWLEYIPSVYGNKHGICRAKALEKLEPLFQRHAGTLKWYCLDFWSAQLDLNIAQLKAEINDRISIRPSTIDFLTWLQKQNCEVVLLTNAHQDSLSIKMSVTHLEHYFDRIITSHQLGYAKEQPPFWPALNNHMAFDPRKTLLIDDSVAVLDAAKNYGVAHLLCVKQPDTLKPVRTHLPYPALQLFNDIAPI